MKRAVEYRGVARDNLRNNWGNAIIVCLITFAVSTLLGFVPVIGTIGSILLAGPLMVAEIIYFVKLHKNEDATINSMFVDFGKNLINNFLTYILQTLFIILWSLLFIVPGIIKSYSYAMTMYLKAKRPELEANEAITMSRQIMDGKKWTLSCLHFSFIGWIILSIITLGIGLIFLLPYMQASITAFYEDAYNEYQQKINSDDNAENEISVEEKN